ncbi:glycoside hydrolase family 3 C-terminal domain-containing protein [Nocardioides nematodiphilus]|uniref:glycoside hydrolase family 3 C-terminal domain-containing protein n=1 Tax=Nocardioides nematodiphilus TaxID=2849669 RepID=UPI001CD9B6B8|nr:glycoside hydrolase family 3 C-terminal domain-containing protein [Nocardioides nematodiphilus]MCA1982210.1 glycoside hydrolase family 3 C-terminal domain-containing protein [Nocardioides nematodiphilus]
MVNRQRRHAVVAFGTAVVAGTLAATTLGNPASASRPAPTPPSASQASSTPVYLNRSFTPAERAADLVSRMTLAEKAQEMNSSQAPAIPRLGIAAWGWWNESNHGVNASTITPTGNATTLTNTTSYPSDLSMGSTWDPKLVYREASLIGDEARDTAPQNRFNLDFYAPTVNLSRDPRWGRNDESWSEDPTLTATLASQYVDGLQGQTPAGVLPASANGYYKAIATLKHYAANNSEVNRRNGSSDMDQRTLREYYTKQFADIVKAAHPGSIMSSYNSINGVPAAASVQLMSDLARDTYGFDGYFTSDCDAVREIQNGHHWQPPTASAPLDQYGRSAYAISAGEDLDCNWGYHDQYSYGNTVPTAIAQKIKTEVDTFNVGDVDTSVTRLFTARIATGEFDEESQVPWVRAARQRLGGATWTTSPTNNAITETPERLAQARESAQEGLVLLKNDKVGAAPLLPLDLPQSQPTKVAVVGYFAHPQQLFTGGYSSIQTGAGAANNIDAYTGIKDAIQARNPQAQVDFLPGVTGGTTASKLTTVDPATIAAVKGYDAVVVVAGTDYTTASEDHDRTTTALPGAQASMISQVEAANPHTVVYLQTVGSVDVRSFEATSPAILWSSYLGQRQGAAIADVLLGTVNPSGHLPFTWYTDDSQLPAITDYAIRPSQSAPGRTYMYYTGTPSFPFGHGLSYGTFRFSDLKVAKGAVRASGTISATATVTNTGTVAGAATPQLYVTTPFASAAAERPVKRLLAFDRVVVKPGQSVRVHFTAPASQLAFLDEKSQTMKVDRGTYGLQLGASSSDVRARASVTVTGRLGSLPATVSVRPVETGDAAADVAQRVAFDAGTRIDPQVTVATDDEALHGYIAKGRSTPLPEGMKIRYHSNRRDVVAVEQGGTELRAVGSGVATVTVDATYHGRTVSTSFVVNVAPLQITSAPAATFIASTAGSFTVTTVTTQSPTAQEVPSLSVAGRLPAGLTFTDNGDGTGTFSGTPTAAGTFTVRVRASNEVSPTATQELTLTVS